MRILAITSRFPRPGYETNAIYSLLQLAALKKTHDVRVVVPVPWTERLMVESRKGRSPRELELSGLPIYYPTFWFPPKILGTHYGSFYLKSMRRTMDRILKEFTPHAVFATWAHPDGWAAVKIARELGVPVLIKVIGSDVLVLGRENRRRSYVAQALQQADGVLAVSHDLAEHVALLGVDPRKIHVVSEGTDTNLFRPGDQASARGRLGLATSGRMLLFVGNLLFSKGAGLVIEACGLLRDQGVDFTCYLVGRGRDDQRLRQLAARLGLDNRVIFAGGCSQDRLADWYQATDVMTLPSYSEGIPNVLREAMCCGKPFVATRVGGIPEISSPEISRIVDVGDVPELARALREMLAAPPRVDQRMTAPYVITWDQSAAMIDSLLHKVVTAERPGATMEQETVFAPPSA